MLQVTYSPNLFSRPVLCPLPPMPNPLPGTSHLRAGEWINECWTQSAIIMTNSIPKYCLLSFSISISQIQARLHYNLTLIFQLLSQFPISSQTLQHWISLMTGIILPPLYSDTISSPIPHWAQHQVFPLKDQVPPNVSPRLSLLYSVIQCLTVSSWGWNHL